MIPKSELIDMFAAIAKETDWNMAGEMAWGYFFTDDDRNKLEVCSDRLIKLGYRFVEILDGDEPDDPLTLQVSKMEIHTPESLFQRNQELATIAEEIGISSYDGMDVGPIDDHDDDMLFEDTDIDDDD